jgi:transposase InsO family protein
VIFAAIADWADSKEYPVVFMCTELGVSRSGYYAWRNAVPSQRDTDDEALIVILRHLHAQARGNPGVRRLWAALAVAGHRVGHKRVHRLMRLAGLRGRHPQVWKRTTVQGGQSVNAPDLIGRSFVADGPNQKWCGDITYVKTWDGWAYVATVIDLYSRAIVGYAIADHMRTSLVTDALDMAIANRAPAAGVIFHSDRGTQGGFNRSSQHLDHGGVHWDERVSSCRKHRWERGGSGLQTGRCEHRCARQAGRSRHALCSESSGA